MASRHCPIPHHQAASNGAQGRFNAADVRTMMGIDQPADRGFAQAQTLGQGNIGDALATHGRVERQLRGECARPSGLSHPGHVNGPVARTDAGGDQALA